jgi:hypothetical protein
MEMGRGMKYPFNDQDAAVFDRIVEARRTIRILQNEVPSDEMIKSVNHAGICAPYASLVAAGKPEYRRFFVIKQGSEYLNRINDIVKRAAQYDLQKVEEKATFWF